MQSHLNVFREAIILFVFRKAVRYVFREAVTFILSSSNQSHFTVFRKAVLVTTSNIPTLNRRPELFYPAGMFTCPDGSKYGITYSMSADGHKYAFTVTSKKSDKDTVRPGGFKDSFVVMLVVFVVILTTRQTARGNRELAANFIKINCILPQK